MAVAPITRPLSSALRFFARIQDEDSSLFLNNFDQYDNADEFDLLWMHWQFYFTRATPTGTVEDAAIIGWDIVNLTSGVVDYTWDSADFTAVNNKLFAFWTSMKPYTSAEYRLASIKAYERRFAQPITATEKFQDSGAAKFVNNFASEPGSNAGEALPYQVALSVTEKTPLRRHWGRFYWPGASESMSGPAGRWTSSTVTGVRAAAETLYSDLYDLQFPVVVASTQSDKVFNGRLVGVTEVQVDDIPDVIRRRRAKQPAIRSSAIIND